MTARDGRVESSAPPGPDPPRRDGGDPAASAAGVDAAARWKTLAVLAVCGLLALGLVLERTVFRDRAPSRRAAPEAIFLNRQGRPVALSDYRGKVVLLNFWATWCPPCVEEVPSLERLAAELKRSAPGVEVIAPALDDQGFSVIDPFVKRMGVQSFTVLHDRNKHAFRFGTRKLPETWLIGPDGEILDRFVGPREWDDPRFVAMLTKASRSR